ncbi:MAG TPA: enolase C-terminal domain-like protein [Candidatus Limnocylindrales bacterium]|nr:enolase C-terminal domain-like protein [Candidatus Limnocylindrales bacterium]
MTLRLRHEVLQLALRDPFRIARTEHGGGHQVTTVIVELEDDRLPGLVGYGEGYPDTFYGETPATMVAVWPRLLEAVGEPELSAAGLVAAGDAMSGALRWNGAAKCALDSALLDLVGKATGTPAWRLLGLSTSIPPTDFTIGLDEPAIVAERARRAKEFPALKIKVGGPADLATLRTVRDVYDGPIRVDANTGWTPGVALELLPELAALGVELIEQPFPAGRLDWLAELQGRSSLPIVADESCVTDEDLDALVGVVAGVNVKLAKCGGPGAAARMLARARGLGFRTFLGCMEETSVLIAASAAVASLADWVDLDGNLLLADDPFGGLELGSDHAWILGEAAGLGVTRRRQPPG